MARRIAIIDHDNHELIIEDINEQELEEKYGGDEQAYIDDNYYLENYSWDWVIEAFHKESGEVVSNRIL
jgi:hypothetical protein